MTKKITFEIITLLPQEHPPTAPSSPFWPFALELELLVFSPVMFWLEPKHAYRQPPAKVERRICNGSELMTVTTLKHPFYGGPTMIPIMVD